MRKIGIFTFAIVSLFIGVFLQSCAHAQVNGGVTSSGAITAGHGATFKSKSQIIDSGGAPINNGTTAGGDLSGTYPNPTVAKLQGNGVVNTNPLNSQCLVFTGTFPTGTWGPGSCAGGSGGVSSIIAGTGITIASPSTCITNCTVSITPVITAAGPIGDSSHVAQITYNAQGQLTTVNSVAIALSALGILPCAQLPTFTGDVTNSACGMTIASSVVTNAKLASMTAPSVKGVVSTGNPVDLTPTQVTANFCNLATVSLKGCAAILSGNATDYYGGDGAYHALVISTSGNPTATAGPAAVNGSSPNFMRADGAPAVQKGTNAQFGLIECDNVLIDCSGTPGVATLKGGANAGQCLSNTSPPTYVAGCRVSLVTLTAAASASLSDTTHITATFNHYDLLIENIICSAVADLRIQIAIGGVFQTATYNAQILIGNGTATAATAFTAGVTISNSGGCNTGAPGISATITLPIPSNTSVQKILRGIFYESSSGTTLGGTAFGFWGGSNAAINGVQLIPSTGTLTTGTMEIVGYN